MKKIITFLIITIFSFTSFSNISLGIGTYSQEKTYSLSSQDRAYISSAAGNYAKKVFQKYGIHGGIEKLVKIIRKVDKLRENFKNRNIKNKQKIFSILEVIRNKIKLELGNISSKLLTDTDKRLLKEVGIIRDNINDSVFLDSGIEVYKMGNKKIDNPNGLPVVYFVRFLLRDINDTTNPKNYVYIKKGLFNKSLGKVEKSIFVAKLGVYSPSDLYEIWYDRTNAPGYCFQRIPNSLYKGTYYFGIKSDSLAYMSTSLNELANKIKQNPNWKFPANKKGNLCQNGNFWVKFKANSNLATEIKKIPTALQKLK